MNTNNNNPQGPDLGKTFVEDEGAKTGVHSLGANKRLDATSVRGANPYAASGAPNLPTGNEPIALGSGSIVGLLGTGGMARVYKIWNDKLEVFRAVKILIPNQQGDVRNRFETEAKITAKLQKKTLQMADQGLLQITFGILILEIQKFQDIRILDLFFGSHPVAGFFQASFFEHPDLVAGKSNAFIKLRAHLPVKPANGPATP